MSLGRGQSRNQEPEGPEDLGSHSYKHLHPQSLWLACLTDVNSTSPDSRHRAWQSGAEGITVGIQDAVQRQRLGTGNQERHPPPLLT